MGWSWSSVGLGRAASVAAALVLAGCAPAGAPHLEVGSAFRVSPAACAPESIDDVPWMERGALDLSLAEQEGYHFGVALQVLDGEGQPFEDPPPSRPNYGNGAPFKHVDAAHTVTYRDGTRAIALSELGSAAIIGAQLPADGLDLVHVSLPSSTLASLPSPLPPGGGVLQVDLRFDLYLDGRVRGAQEGLSLSDSQFKTLKIDVCRGCLQPPAPCAEGEVAVPSACALPGQDVKHVCAPADD